MKKFMTPLVPATAMVTVPASDYYWQLRELEALRRERDDYVGGISVKINEAGNASVEYKSQKVFGNLIPEEIAKQCAAQEDVMRRLLESNSRYFDIGYTWFSAYSGADLLEFPEFRKEWERLQAEALEQAEKQKEEVTNGNV